MHHFLSWCGVPADAFIQYVPLGRYDSSDSFAEVVALLASDRSQWLTGPNLRVDGGITAR